MNCRAKHALPSGRKELHWVEGRYSLHTAICIMKLSRIAAMQLAQC
jgi:hypothetical protein